MKDCEKFCKAQTASRLEKLIQLAPNPPHQIKRLPTLLRLRKKFFVGRYIGIYRPLLSKCFKNAVPGRQEMVQSKYFF